MKFSRGIPTPSIPVSLSARGAWIEIVGWSRVNLRQSVALRKGSVD